MPQDTGMRIFLPGPMMALHWLTVFARSIGSSRIICRIRRGGKSFRKKYIKNLDCYSFRTKGLFFKRYMKETGCPDLFDIKFYIDLRA